MATYHCSVKVGGKGKGAAHAAYISRVGQYVNRSGLEHCEHGNLPPWAQHDPLTFWRAADANERVNGAVYREIEVALPRELTLEQRLALIHEFIQHHLGQRHAYTLAIHNSAAALDGGEQPHAHLMFSERVQDGKSRDPEQYFKRYNAKVPERGGCRKDSMGTAERLEGFRQSWADLTNQALERHGHTARVDHRSYQARGLERAPERHLGPVSTRQLSAPALSALTEYRQAQQALEQTRQAVSQLDVAGQLHALRIHQAEAPDAIDLAWAEMQERTRGASPYELEAQELSEQLTREAPPQAPQRQGGPQRQAPEQRRQAEEAEREAKRRQHAKVAQWQQAAESLRGLALADLEWMRQEQARRLAHQRAAPASREQAQRLAHLERVLKLLEGELARRQRTEIEAERQPPAEARREPPQQAPALRQALAEKPNQETEPEAEPDDDYTPPNPGF